MKLQIIRRQYELLFMSDHESIANYFSQVQMLVNAMKAYKEELTDQQVVGKVLRTSTPRFDHVVVAIEE